jgi:hypothetical protein
MHHACIKVLNCWEGSPHDTKAFWRFVVESREVDCGLTELQPLFLLDAVRGTGVMC